MHPLRTRVKLCGMTRLEDIRHAVDLGVDAVGFIFYHKSPRAVSKAKVKTLIQNLPPFVDAVAVLVNPDVSFVQELIAELPIQLLQFHGDETEQFCEQFKKPYIKAIHPKSAQDIQNGLRDFQTASALLLDTPSDTLQGGTGMSFDWGIIPETLTKPYILAGGLRVSNVAQAIEICKPYAVDLCSGLECAPGVKDHDKMTELMNVLRGK